MHVLNIHEREFDSPSEQVGALIDTLSSRNDRLWPKDIWPPMEFDRPLAVGAVGGHGPIRYSIEEFQPGRSIKFRFLGPSGFDGFHAFDVRSDNSGRTVLRNTLEMNSHGPALMTWPFVFRPLHDALMEDAMARAQASLGVDPEVKGWSAWVRLLRWILSGGKARSQRAPSPSAGVDDSG